MSDDEPGATPELRIGDRERRATDDRLRAALDEGRLTLAEYDERAADCFAARHQRELDVLLADLPADGSTAPSEAATVAAPVPADTAARPTRPAADGSRGLASRLGSGGLVAAVVLGIGVWVAPSVFGADGGAAVFGSRTVAVTPGQESVQVGVLFGSTRVVVPDGTAVTTDGTLVFGSTDCDEACSPAPGAPTVTVSRSGAFGSVDVVTASQQARGEDPGDRDDDEDDD